MYISVYIAAIQAVGVLSKCLSPWAQRRVSSSGEPDPSLRSGWQPGHRSRPLTCNFFCTSFCTDSRMTARTPLTSAHGKPSLHMSIQSGQSSLLQLSLTLLCYT